MSDPPMISIGIILDKRKKSFKPNVNPKKRNTNARSTNSSIADPSSLPNLSPCLHSTITPSDEAFVDNSQIFHDLPQINTHVSSVIVDHPSTSAPSDKSQKNTTQEVDSAIHTDQALSNTSDFASFTASSNKAREVDTQTVEDSSQKSLKLKYTPTPISKYNLRAELFGNAQTNHDTSQAHDSQKSIYKPTPHSQTPQDKDAIGPEPGCNDLCPTYTVSLSDKDQVNNIQALDDYIQQNTQTSGSGSSQEVVEVRDLRNNKLMVNSTSTDATVYSNTDREDNSPASPYVDSRMTIADLNNFVVKAGQKDFDPSQPRLQLEETEDRNPTPWFLRPLSEIQKESNTMYRDRQGNEKEMITSDQYLESLKSDPSFKRSSKKQSTTKKTSEELGLPTASLRREKLVEISRYDASLDSKSKNNNKTLGEEEEVYSAPAVPQVKIVNGEIVLDTESLVVERTQAIREEDSSRIPPGPPSTRRSAHYAKRNSQYANRKWSDLEVKVFYDGLALYGTDFAKIAATIPEKDRFQVKNKYKVEEKKNPSKINEYLLKGTKESEQREVLVAPPRAEFARTTCLDGVSEDMSGWKEDGICNNGSFEIWRSFVDICYLILLKLSLLV